MSIAYRIYKITNLVNNKIYIGITRATLDRRLNEHRKESRKNKPKRIITKAIVKYGIEKFTIEQLDTAENLDIAYKAEIHYIKKFNSYYKNKPCCGYNMTLGGPGGHGYMYTAKQKKNQSESLKKYYTNHPEAIIRLQNNVASLETRKKQAEKARARKGKHTEESKEKRRKSMTGKIYTHRRLKFYLKSPENIIYKIEGLCEFCRKHNLERSCVAGVIKKKHTHHKNWTIPSHDEIMAFETQKLARTCDISP